MVRSRDPSEPERGVQRRRLTVGQKSAGLSFEKIVSSVFWRYCADLLRHHYVRVFHADRLKENAMLKEAELTEEKSA